MSADHTEDATTVGASRPWLTLFCSDRDGAKGSSDNYADAVPSKHDGKATTVTPRVEKPNEGSTGSDQIDASGGASRDKDS